MAILLTMLLQAACSDSNRQPLVENAVVLAFGDSLTKGKGVGAQDSYPSELSRLIHRPVLNYGVSGETTSEGLRRLPDVLLKTTPNLMILMHGGNDILRNIRRSETRDNLAAMIELGLSRGTQVVLIGIPEKSLFSSSAPQYLELAEEYGLAFDDTIISTLLKKSEMKSDMLHFNKAGYSAVADRIHELLQSEGLL
ncbi:MAG: GDSL-type esterase/lipase family protein [Pseudomonadales bacterium]